MSGSGLAAAAVVQPRAPAPRSTDTHHPGTSAAGFGGGSSLRLRARLTGCTLAAMVQFSRVDITDFR